MQTPMEVGGNLETDGDTAPCCTSALRCMLTKPARATSYSASEQHSKGSRRSIAYMVRTRSVEWVDGLIACTECEAHHIDARSRSCKTVSPPFLSAILAG
jgi:hypothetical protein